MKTIRLTLEDTRQGSLILVNDEHPLGQDLHEDHLVLLENQKMQRDAARLFMKLLDHCQCHQDIVVVSGYRSFHEQVELYGQSLKENGEDYTKKFVALPHCSEHETGLAIDLALKSDTIDMICPDFPYEGICQKVRETAYDFGFIERYSEYKQHITHIAKEPWHFRYVGYPHSQIIKEHNFCLEEYHDFIQQFSLYNPYIYVENQRVVEIFYVPVEKSETIIALRDDVVAQISGDNMNGVIVTAWRTCL